jgi:hypothetical protein
VEATMSEHEGVAERLPLTADIEFAVDAPGVINASAIDLSDSGIGFEVDRPLRVALTFEHDGEEVIRRAELTRVVRTDNGYLFGLQFVEEED